MIRNARSEDLPAMVDMARAMWMESNYHAMRFSPEKARLTGQAIIDNPNGFAVVAEQGGELVGVMMAVAGAHWCGHDDDLMASDCGLYVKPEQRHNGIALALARAYRDWGVEKGYAQLRAGGIAGKQARGVDRIYGEVGFDFAGNGWVYDPRS